jgi:hypothetical protein
MDGAADESRADAGATTQAVDEPRTPARSALVEEAARVAATLNDKLPMLSDETHASGNHHKAAPERAHEPPARAADAVASGATAAHGFGGEDSVAESARESALTATTTPPQAETRGRVGRRAATVGASVGENLRPRVEKLREASTVVFDEATDDPGLRFVIIAIVLFLLFLFILLFSYILG